MKSVILIAIILSVSCTYSANIGSVFGEGPVCPIDDPSTINPGRFNISIPPLIVIDVGSMQGGGVSLGLKSLVTFTTFNLIETSLTFEVTIKSAEVVGIDYSATGVINAGPISADILPSGPFAGSGYYRGAVTDFIVKGKATFLVNLITNRITCRILVVDDLAFGELAVHLEKLVVGGTQVDWVTWNANIRANFDADWSANRVPIIEHVRVSANEKLVEYTIQDILDLISDDRPCPTEAPLLA